MGLSSSRCATRQEPCCQDAERPNAKTSEYCVIGSSISEGSNIAQVSAIDQCPDNCHSSTRELLDESQQQIKQEASGSAQVRERRVHQPPRILSRTRQVYMDPLTSLRSRRREMVNEDNPRILCRQMHVNSDSLTRFPLRQSERQSESGHGQYSIEEIQARLRSYTGSSSSYMDTANRTRQQVSDSTSQTRINDRTSDLTSRYNGAGVSSSHRGRTGIASAGEIDGCICDTAGSSRYARRIASGPSQYADLRGSSPLCGELTGRESRRNGGRRFWDVLTRAASQRRLSNYQETQEAARHLLLPCNSRSALPNSRIDTTAFPNVERGRNTFRNRSLNLDERRRRFRSQVWSLQRLSTSFESVPGHPRPCVRRVNHESVQQSHPTTQSIEETDTRASISRIIMLAEALFQVLDEIHRQSVALSQSAGLSVGALRAPDAVVDSMPLRIFQKADTVESKEEAALQCHICLLEYEVGDHLRVLPCHHEYHMICIDKWLREVHRVCPLCRGDVCELIAMEK